MPEGAKVWYIPDCWRPAGGNGVVESHEAICVLNVTDEPAALTMTVYFADRDPIENVRIDVPAKRTAHLGTNVPAHIGGVEIPEEVGYAVRIESSVPIVVQYTRLDCSAPMALMTTMALPG
jgi:hypothetical protein